MHPAPTDLSAAGPPHGRGWFSLYAARRKIYPRSVQGRFNRLRWAAVWGTQLLFYGLPWLTWNDRQAVWFDLSARKFYLFGLMLWPQDLIYLAGLLVIAALALFFFTAVAGRLWCGYACPQTVYTEMFLWVEQRIEGDRPARMRLDAAPWSLRKLRIKASKHTVWLLLAGMTGLTFVGYFTPIRSLVPTLWHGQLGPWPLFWIGFYSLATWGNAGFMREQVCKYMCPYARFQGAMFDADTLTVAYDARRGEPRRNRSATPASPAAEAGSCIDCTRCVQVCPTGIDIRQGLQYECIGCGACIDACDAIMDRIGAPRGLIRYASERTLAQPTTDQPKRHAWLRPRVLGYGVLLLGISAAWMIALAQRNPLRIDVQPDRHALGRIAAEGMLENSFRLHLMNAAEHPRVLTVKATGLPGLHVAGNAQYVVPAAGHRVVAVALRLPVDNVTAGAHPVTLTVGATDDPTVVRQETTPFIVPELP